MSICTMYCFAYSGGTVLSKCLGSISKDVILISEVNPLYNHIRTKVSKHHLPDFNLSSEEFTEQLLELQRYCDDQKRFLIIRDWTYINFHPHAFKNIAQPPNKLLLHEQLKMKTEVKGFAFVRDAIDVCISHSCTPDFFDHYQKYIHELISHPEIKVFKYEDFCLNPGKTLKELCDYLGLEYSDAWKNFSSFKKVSGDTGTNKRLSRGGSKDYIFLPKRKRISRRKIRQINRNPIMKNVNQVLLYPPQYDNGNVDQSIRNIAKEETRPYWQKVKKLLRTGFDRSLNYLSYGYFW